MDRVILHCDCNSYFASVACITRPELRDVPMAVSNGIDGKHGVVLAKNQLAKARGVVTAESVLSALRKCPELTLVRPQHDLYEEYCRRVNDIYGQYTDQVEAFGIDESWLDVTGSLHLFGSGKEIADTLRKRIWEELKLTISVGVSFNKVYAKLGSDYKKPDATTVITRENFRSILFPLPVSALLFAGRTTVAALNAVRIRTIGDLAAAPPEALEKLLGKQGRMLWIYANGLEDSPVKHIGECDPIKSIGNGVTFDRNLLGIEDIRAGLRMLCDQVGTRLRRQGLQCMSVQVQIKNPDLKVISRQKMLSRPTDLTHAIYETALEIVLHAWDVKKPIRMFAVSVTRLCPKGECEQMTLFEEETATVRKRERLETAIDQIRTRFGHDAVSYASLIKNDIVLGGEDGAIIPLKDGDRT